MWRNIIPYLLPLGRCLAPDYVGMGHSGKAPDGAYRFADHARYLDAWFEALDLKKNVTLIVHDWGSALGLILERNLFIEYLLPLRGISKEAMEVYRRHYTTPGPSRQPMLTWTRELPIAGEPADMIAIVDAYARWMSSNRIPKLFINGDPAGFLIGAQREFCRTWFNQHEVTVKGAHFLHEDAREEIGRALARFVGEVQVGQLKAA